MGTDAKAKAQRQARAGGVRGWCSCRYVCMFLLLSAVVLWGAQVMSPAPGLEPRADPCTISPDMATPLIRPFEPLWKLKSMQLSAFVVGGTGAVGKALVRELVRSKMFETVTYIGRRRVEYEGPEAHRLKQRLVDFSDPNHPDFIAAFSGHDVGFCALGTTRGKAGALGFVKVDRTYVGAVAAAAYTHGTKHFHLVSSAGADANSWFLYPQTKGLVEADVASLGFPRLSIYRPSLLLVVEGREEQRAIETAIAPFAKAFSVVSDSVAIAVEDVATAMIANTFLGPQGALGVYTESGSGSAASESGAGDGTDEAPTPPPPAGVALVSLSELELVHPGAPMQGCLTPQEWERRQKARAEAGEGTGVRGSTGSGSAVMSQPSGSDASSGPEPQWPCTEILSNAVIRQLATQVRAEDGEPACDGL